MSDHHPTVASSFAGRQTLARHIEILLTVAALVAASHLVLYTGFALDDWFPLAHAQFGGTWQTGGDCPESG